MNWRIEQRAKLPGSHLKSSLTYPNGLTAAWSYEPARDLLTQVVNAQPDGTVISSYTYTNDLLGRRTSKNTEQYGYNVRDELISSDEVSYAYDDIGNRTTAEGKSYTANNLNHYTAIDDFTPTYDLDGNQTTVKTATGIWQVEYNAENRPVRWTQGAKVITMAFDRLGRRVSYREMNGATQIAHTVFLYNGYLCIQQLFSNSPWNVYKEFIWDPTEPVATRPLAFRQYGKTATFLMHDGNKNVTDVVTVGPANTPVAHYDYAPFGAATLSGTRALDNPFRFSSEFADDSLGLVYYNYRHYNPTDGRWLGRDPLEILDQEYDTPNAKITLYLFCKNTPITSSDRIGLDVYVYRGGDGRIPIISTHLHRKVCVDTWRFNENTCCMEKGEKECFTFAMVGEFRIEKAGIWLNTGIQLWGLPGGVGPDSPEGTETLSFRTSCRGDAIALEFLEGEVLKRGAYSFRHNCWTYSNDRFYLLKSMIEGMLPPSSGDCLCPYPFYRGEI
ncbi:MAG: RHS repeat domain-containing protein [Candidatus Spyradenecus sp.]